PSHHRRRVLHPLDPPAQVPRIHPDRVAQVLEAVGPDTVAARHVGHRPLVLLAVPHPPAAIGPLGRGGAAVGPPPPEPRAGPAPLPLGPACPRPAGGLRGGHDMKHRRRAGPAPPPPPSHPASP